MSDAKSLDQDLRADPRGRPSCSSPIVEGEEARINYEENTASRQGHLVFFVRLVHLYCSIWRTLTWPRATTREAAFVPSAERPRALSAKIQISEDEPSRTRARSSVLARKSHDNANAKWSQGCHNATVASSNPAREIPVSSH